MARVASQRSGQPGTAPQGGPPAVRHPHLGDDGPPQGCTPIDRKRTFWNGRTDRPDPAPGRGERDHRFPSLPLVGIRELRPLADPRGYRDPRWPLRPWSHGRTAGHPQTRDPDRRSGDAAADGRVGRSRGNDPPAASTPDSLGIGFGPARKARYRLDGPLRREPLQPLRLDRGRLRLGGRPERTEGRPRHGRKARQGYRGTSPGPGGSRRPPRRGGTDLRAERDGLRGILGWLRQGTRRWLRIDRGCRPLRGGTPAGRRPG